MIEAEVIIDIPFHDVDAMNVVWHGHYVKYFEVARCALLDTIDYNYLQMHESKYQWPIVDMRLKYIRPATFARKVKVYAKLVEYEYRLKIEYKISDLETGIKLTSGYTIQVAVDMTTKEMCFVSPPILLEKLGIEVKENE